MRCFLLLCLFATYAVGDLALPLNAQPIDLEVEDDGKIAGTSLYWYNLDTVDLNDQESNLDLDRVLVSKFEVELAINLTGTREDIPLPDFPAVTLRTYAQIVQSANDLARSLRRSVRQTPTDSSADSSSSSDSDDDLSTTSVASSSSSASETDDDLSTTSTTSVASSSSSATDSDDDTSSSSSNDDSSATSPASPSSSSSGDSDDDTSSSSNSATSTTSPASSTSSSDSDDDDSSPSSTSTPPSDTGSSSTSSTDDDDSSEEGTSSTPSTNDDDSSEEGTSSTDDEDNILNLDCENSEACSKYHTSENDPSQPPFGLPLLGSPDLAITACRSLSRTASVKIELTESSPISNAVCLAAPNQSQRQFGCDCVADLKQGDRCYNDNDCNRITGSIARRRSEMHCEKHHYTCKK